VREIVCPICGGHERRLLYRETFAAEPSSSGAPRIADPEGVHYRINRCAGCGLVNSNPIFDEADVAALYTRSPHTNVRTGEEANVRRTAELYYRLARPYLAGKERMLDIGCDIGLLLSVARQDGFRELHGIEPNPLAAKEARGVAGSDITEMFYEETDFPPAHFDLVTLIHVVDHLVEVNRFLARVLRDLKVGGVAVAAVHNVRSLLARGLGERFPPYNVYHHYFFSPRTLGQLFARAGFEVLWVGSTYNCYSLGFLWDKVPRVPGVVRSAGHATLRATRLSRVPVTLPLGNIGIVARKQRADREAL